MTQNSRMVFEYLKANHGQLMTAQSIAAALGVTVSAVTGSVNGLIGRENKADGTRNHAPYAVRTEAEVADAEGKVSKVKYISLTEEGLAFNPDAE